VREFAEEHTKVKPCVWQNYYLIGVEWEDSPFGVPAHKADKNHMEHTDTVPTSLETHYVSDTENNRLML
jgi:hypothetical protein